MGPIALHGGGEFLPGDEPFLDALLAAAVARGGAGVAPGDDIGTIRVAVMPTAAARGRPDLAGANGVDAFLRRGAATGREVRADIAMVLDERTANDAGLADLVGSADVVYLPGGDPDLIPTILRDSAVEGAMRSASRGGAVVAGASAGAMALAAWTWTPGGGMPGLGWVAGLAVVPHFDDARRQAWQRALDGLAPAGLGYLGLDERTGVISAGDEGDAWVVAGEGAAYWFAPDTSTPIMAGHGERLRTGRQG